MFKCKIKNDCPKYFHKFYDVKPKDQNIRPKGSLLQLKTSKTYRKFSFSCRGANLQHRADDGKPTNLRDIAYQDVVNQKNITKSLLQWFRSIWKHEYLIELREYHKKYGQHSNIVSVGDIVLNSEEPTVAWRVGRVIELVCRRDGIARSVKLVTISEHENQSTLRRPVNKLVPLEVTRTVHDAEEQIRDEANTIQLTFVDDGNIPERVDIMSSGGA